MRRPPDVTLLEGGGGWRGLCVEAVGGRVRVWVRPSFMRRRRDFRHSSCFTRALKTEGCALVDSCL